MFSLRVRIYTRVCLDESLDFRLEERYFCSSRYQTSGGGVKKERKKKKKSEGKEKTEISNRNLQKTGWQQIRFASKRVAFCRLLGIVLRALFLNVVIGMGKGQEVGCGVTEVLCAPDNDWQSLRNKCYLNAPSTTVFVCFAAAQSSARLVDGVQVHKLPRVEGGGVCVR